MKVIGRSGGPSVYAGVAVPNEPRLRPTNRRSHAEPPADGCHDRLHRLGWSSGEACFLADAGAVWQVDGTEGERVIVARAPTRVGAWRLAQDQVEAGVTPDLIVSLPPGAAKNSRYPGGPY